MFTVRINIYFWMAASGGQIFSITFVSLTIQATCNISTKLSFDSFRSVSSLIWFYFYYAEDFWKKYMRQSWYLWKIIYSRFKKKKKSKCNIMRCKSKSWHTKSEIMTKQKLWDQNNKDMEDKIVTYYINYEINHYSQDILKLYDKKSELWDKKVKMLT